MTALSVLDLSLITRGGSVAGALANSVDLARLAERLGYHRYWLAEHHAMPGIASAATAVVIGHIAGVTQHIRVGAGGIMLPNHSPLSVAEAFGTLESLYPGRIDLGLGRAPGSDQATMRALRRDPAAADRFPMDVQEVLRYLGPVEAGQRVVAIPGAGLDVPVWLLGSSLFSANLAARLGLPFAFAAHFAPAMMEEAVALYRHAFVPSRYLQAPHVMLCVNVIAADDDATAALLFTSLEQYFVALRSGRPTAFPPPDARMQHDPAQRGMLEQVLRYTFHGGVERVRQSLTDFMRRHRPDELMVAMPIYDHAARCHSLSLLKGLWDGMETDAMAG
ncbi:LLM class flavin-dependent oxidoreductase [Novacetimonas pomaceti]|uniref:LLM class flavin-dependent oxidoreductase n=1 Tax=Novacetimonas pomaceti TaxID=2021998 RepID=UPI001C2CC8A6|nr:LLM class flavin-dependent oxidoreductase [Novacetimonas pomaceti]MBV1832547.1 LLM class flavin-dependent oxidoreductase [Novacetimonas pomaceti]